LWSCAYLCALLLETGQEESPAHHRELGDAELCNLQSAEFAASHQITFTTDEVPIHKHELSDESSGQVVHDAAVPGHVVRQEDSLTSDMCDTDVHHPPFALSSDTAFEDQLGQNTLAEFTVGESLAEVNPDEATYASIHTQEVNAALKQCTNISDDMTQMNMCEKLITEDTDCNVVSVGFSEIQNVGHDGTLNNDKDDTASRCSKSDHESMIVHDSCYSDVSECESCYKDTHGSSVHCSCSADVDTSGSEVPNMMWHTSASSPTCKVERTGSYMTTDPEVYDVASSLDCENGRFADIPVDSRAQHVKLTLDCNEVEAVCSNEDEEQMTQNQLCSLLSSILDKTENLSHEFQSAIAFQQNSDCLNAGIYASLGGMELCDDMELIPVEDEKTGTYDNTDGTEAICDLNNSLDSMKNVTSLSNDHDCVAADNCASLGGMELHDYMELIPVGDDKTDTVHNMEGTKTTCDVKTYSDSTITVTNLSSDADRQMFVDDNAPREFSQVSTSIPELYKCASASHNEQHKETVSGDDSALDVMHHGDELVGIGDVLDRDSNYRVIPQLAESGRLLLTPEHTDVSGTDTAHESSGLEMPQHHMLIPTDEVCNSDNEYSEPVAVLDEVSRTSSMVVVSATASVKSVAEIENVDMLISLETTDVSSAGTVLTELMDSAVFSSTSEVENSYFSNSRNLEVAENGENENSEVLAQPLDSGVRLLFTPEQLSVSDQMLQCTDTEHDSSGQETSQCLLLRPAGELYDSYNEPTAIADKDGRMSPMALVSAAANVTCAAETNNMDTLISLETIDTDSAGTVLTESEHSYVSNSKNVEHFENGENENSTNIGQGSTTDAAHTTYGDLEFHTSSGLSENIMEHHPDLLFLTDEEILTTLYYAHEDFQFSVSGNEQGLERFTADDASLHTQRLELDDLTLTVTCFVPEESEELLPDDVLEQFNESNHSEVPASSPPYSTGTKLTGSDPVMSFDLSHYMDHNMVNSDIILPKHRSSEFMLSYLMPIDETAEFTDDASVDTDDTVPDKSHLLQPGDELSDMKTESGDDYEQKMAYSINATPTVELGDHLCHELTEGVQQNDVATTSGIENARLDGLASNAHDFGMTAITNNGCKLNPSDDKEQIYKESRSSVEHFDGNITVPFSANWQNTVSEVADINKYKSEASVDTVAHNCKAATNGIQVACLPDDSNEYATAAERTALTTNLPLHTCSKDCTTNSDVSTLLAAGATQHSSSVHSAVKTAESNVSDLGDEHSPDTNMFKQRTLETVNGATEHLDNKGKNSENNNIIDLDMKMPPNNETVFNENSITIDTAVLRCQSEPRKQSDETAMKLCERPVLQSNNMQPVLNAIMQGLVQSYETASNTQHTTVEEQPLSTSNKDASCISSVISSSSPVLVVKAAMELEEPAVDAVTDFESILEQLYCTEHNT